MPERASPSPPPRARIVALANQKGGVGKTTTAINAGTWMAAHGVRTLLVDLDPQGNATSSLGIDKSGLASTIHDVITDGAPIAQATIANVRDGLDVLPTTSSLAAAEVDLVSLPERERRLGRALDTVRIQYDVVLIDCPPSLGLLTVNGLTAADHVVIPIQCEFLALEGVSQLITTIDLVKRQLNPELDLIGVLMTMFDARTNLSASVVDEVRRFFPDRIFGAVIPRSVRLAEAPSYGQSITEYDPMSRGGVAYAEFARELIERLAVR